MKIFLLEDDTMLCESIHEYLVSIGHYVDNATIRAEVSRLKKSLKEDFIQNIRVLGYMIDIPRGK